MESKSDMSKFSRLIVLMTIFWGVAPASAQQSAGEVYLFSYFRGDSKDGLHLATSTDGFKWEHLNNDKSFLKPEVGAEKLMRDPTIQRGPDGVFHAVWTNGWRGPSIGYASSPDLLTSSEQKDIPVMKDFPQTRMSWAPELRYDAKSQEWVIYWSSAVADATPSYQSTYATTTKDFKTFTPTKLFFDAGFGQIDASILDDTAASGKFLLFYKHGGQGTRVAMADDMKGPYKDSGAMFAFEGRDEWEGAWPVRIGSDYVVYIDHYRNRNRMGMWRSRDLKQWENITTQSSGLFDMRHGGVIKVPVSVVDQIKKAKPSTRPAN